MSKIVECPETAQLELVDCMKSPLGNLIHRCTRFQPRCALQCSRSCTIELDQARPPRGPIRESDGGLMLQFDLEEI